MYRLLIYKCIWSGYVCDNYVNRYKMHNPRGKNSTSPPGPPPTLSYDGSSLQTRQKMCLLEFPSNSAPISCHGRLPVVLETACCRSQCPRSPGKDLKARRGEGTPHVWLVSGPVGVETQVPSASPGA